MEDPPSLSRTTSPSHSRSSSFSMAGDHEAQMRSVHGDDYVSHKPFYAKQSFGYMTLIALYLCLGIIYLITHLNHDFEETGHLLCMGLYFTAACAYVLVLVGHWHEKGHAFETMHKIAASYKKE